MTPKEFLNWYSFDPRMVTGEYISPDPVEIEDGDTLGIVLLNMGGPSDLDEIQPFLYHLFMDPAIIDIPLPGFLRDWLCRFIAWKRANAKEEEYEAIGGGSPLNEISRQQAEGLEDRLRDQFSETGVDVHTYIAMRYSPPLTEETAQKMADDGIDKVLLLPLYPQYSKTTTGSSLSYWYALEGNGTIPDRPTTFVKEYATQPTYIRALSERIDEGLDNLPDEVREDTELLFSAHGTPVYEMTDRRDPYCCLVHSTIKALMVHRDHDRPFHSAFQSQVGPAEWFGPSVPEKLDELADRGVRSLLVIPIAFVSDHIETDFELDIEAREEAEKFGIEHYEVMNGLNDHPLFIQALTEIALSQLTLAEPVRNTLKENGDQVSFLPQTERPRAREKDRETRCRHCDHVTEALCWSAE